MGVKAQLTLDPTFLLPTEHYISLIGERKDFKPHITSYILDMNADKRQICDHISNKLCLPIHHIHQTDNKIRESIPSWLRNFYEADFVVTDSFHGTVFSIIFNKPFITIGNSMRGMARFSSLLSLFSLENRLLNFNNMNDIDKILANPIDWGHINNRMIKLQNESRDYLKNNII